MPRDVVALTIRDVAQAAGVSQATAARALSNYGSVSAAARERVLAAAAEIGYQPNHIAQALRSGSAKVVSFVPGNIDVPFFARVAHVLADRLEQAGFVLMMASSYESLDRERGIVEAMRSHLTSGLVIAPTSSMEIAHLVSLHESGTPVVSIDRSLAQHGIDSVSVDNLDLSRQAVDHLVALGHRRIATLYDSETIDSSAQRLAGSAGALEGVGTLVPVRGGLTVDEAVAATSAALSAPERPTAVFAADSLMTEATLYSVRRLGLRIPDDVSLVGVDDHSLSPLLDPPLTLMSQPVDEISNAAVDILLGRLQGTAMSQPRDLTLTATLVIRDSTAAPAAH
ncbi:LacI family DNA-binding transcriptional regulator [Microbacterium aurum]